MSADFPTTQPESLKKLGGFEILEKIGEGGMGAVYRAKQISLQRIVALKVLPPRLASDAAYIESFRREARAAARLFHPNIIPVFDAGEAEGHFYYAMEFVRGKTLFRWVQKDGKLNEITVLEIGICLANGLKYAWEKEHLIHCDVKPENIMVDAEGNVKLCDLGLAKTFGDHSAHGDNDEIHGTPQYMAPEQLRGEKVLDTRADIYSLGMALYYALTAQIPFNAESPVASQQQHLVGQLPDPRHYNSDVSENFCRVLEKMLAKDRADRYANWNEVIRDLELVHARQSPRVAAVPLGEGKSTLRRDPNFMVKAALAAAPQPQPQVRSRGGVMWAVAAMLIIASVVGTVLFTRQRPPEAQQDILQGLPPETTPNPPQPPRVVVVPPPQPPKIVEPKPKDPPPVELPRVVEQPPPTPAQQIPTPPVSPPAAQSDDKFIEQLRAAPAKALVRSMDGHTAQVMSVAFSPDGRFILSGSMDKTLKLWDAATGNEVRTFTGAGGFVRCVAFSPDGRFVLGGGEDNTLRLWETATGREVRAFKGHSDRVLSAAFSPDGRFIVSGSGDRTARLWETATGKVLQTFSGHKGWVYAVAFSPDGRQVFTGSSDMTARLWDAATGKEVRDYKNANASITSLALAPDGRYLLAGGAMRRLKLWETGSGAEVSLFVAHTTPVWCVDISPDGRRAVSGSEGLTIVLWDVASAKDLAHLRGHKSTVRSVAFSPDGKHFASASDDKTVKLWKLVEQSPFEQKAEK
jgi:serine/threonine protein kinase